MTSFASPPSPGMHAVARSLAVDRATAEVVEALERSGVRSILLKGPALARWLYDDGALRPYLDCDLLVGPEDVSATEQTLRSLGFERIALDTIPNDWPRHARAWIRPHSPTVDLHLTLPGAEASPQEVWQILSGDTERMLVGGTMVETLAPAGRALMLALHAAKDGAREKKPLHDLAHGLERVPRETWAAAAELAARVQAEAPFATGMRKLPTGRVLATALGLPHTTSARTVLRDRGAPPLSVGLDWFFSHRGARRKLALVARKVVPPRTYLRAWRSIARRGRLGLAVAYLWRPLWVAWRAPTALLALWRARTEARRHTLASTSVPAPPLRDQEPRGRP